MTKKAKTVTVTLKVVIPKGHAISVSGLGRLDRIALPGSRYRLPLMLQLHER